MMMHIINQWDLQLFADREKIPDRVYPVIILQGQPSLCGYRELLKIFPEPLQGILFISVGAATVDIDYFRPDILGHHCLIFQFLQRIFQHLFMR